MTQKQIEKINEIKNRAEDFLSEFMENERQADVYGETENDDKVLQSIEFLEFAIKEAKEMSK
jgi:hypothetical protein